MRIHLTSGCRMVIQTSARYLTGRESYWQLKAKPILGLSLIHIRKATAVASATADMKSAASLSSRLVRFQLQRQE